MRKARDVELIDKLESFAATPFHGTAWRITNVTRDVLQCHASAGRWEPGSFPVLYTSLSPLGAILEVQYHLSQQPVFPSRVKFTLNELRVECSNLIRLSPRDLFEELGVENSLFASLSCGRCQEIGDAARFLGFQGMLVPSARSDAENLVVFCDELAPHELELITTKSVDLSRQAEG